MYKKLHTQAKESLAEPYCRKGSFAWFRTECLCKLNLYILYTLKTEKTTGSNQLFFLFHEW